jgi:tetratricopeptide (TPR) repeat protein
LLRELADLCECGLGDPGRAAAAHARLLEVEPGNVEALRDLHRLYRQMGEDARLAAVCRQLAAVVADGVEQGALLREAGEILDARLDRPEEAAECFRALADASPLDRDAAVVLARLYERLGRPADLAFALELRRAQEGKGPAGREVAYKLAELRRTSLDDGPGALSIFALLLTEDPAHEGVLGSLETWVREGAPGEADAMALLDPALSRLEEHDRRVRLREAQAARASPPERARLEAEICRLYESDMGQPEMAFVVACRAFARGLEREGFSATMERLASEMTNGLEELADVYEAVASEGRSKADRLPPLRRAAQLRMHLGETERAVALWNSLLAEGPGDVEALDALAGLHQKSANARELAEVYRQKASLAEDPEERALLLLEAARAKKALAEDDSAIELSRAALALRPGHRATLELLDFAYQGVHRPQEHADVLKLLSDATEEGPTRRATQLRRALLLEKEGWGPEAVEAYAAVLAGSRGEASAVGGLERLLEREESRLPAARALEGHYRGVKDGRRLAEVLEVKLPQAEKEERVALLWEVSRLRETLGQRPLAFAAMLRCFHEDPAIDKIRDELERLAAETGAFDDLAAAYEDELDRGAPEALALTLWRRLGSVYSERLARPDLSARALEEVARRAPHDDTVLSSLSRLYRRGNALKELCSVLRRQVDLAADAASRRDLLAELARLCEERLQDRPAAIEAWQGILASDEADHEARAALALLYGDSGRHEELAALLADEIALADRLGKSERALELAVRLGRLKQTHLADPRGALSLFVSVLEKREAHAGAVAALEEMAAADGPMRADAALALEPLFAKGSDHTRLVQVLEARAQASSGPEKGALLRRVAELYEGPGQSPEMAFLAATRAMESCPDDSDTLAVCVRTVGPAGAHEELAALIGELLPLARGDGVRARLSRALAALWEGPLADPVRAAETWRRVSALVPDDAEALAHLEALFREAEDWGELHDVLKRQLALEKHPDARAALLLRLGDLQDDRLRDTGAAVATFRRLLELNPEDTKALERLDGLYDRNERWAELSEILLREIAMSAAQGLLEQEITQKFRLAQLRELKSLDRSGAMALYREILEVRPGHAETVLHLESVVAREPAYDEASEILAAAYRATQSHGKLARLLDERSAAVAEPERRKQYLAELARIRSPLQERPEQRL